MVHEMVDVKSTEEHLKGNYTQVGEHLYVKTNELHVKPLTEKERRNLQIVLMMGGKGTRLLHRTNNGEISKHMIEVGGQPISKFTIDLWKGGGFSDFCFLLDNSDMGKTIQSFYEEVLNGMNNSFSIEPKKLGSGGALKFAIENGSLKGPFINHFPDDQIIDYPNFSEDLAKVFVAAMKVGYQAVVVCTPGTLYPYGEVIDEDGKVVDFVEKPFIPKDSNTGVFAISLEAFDLIKELDVSKGPVKIERTVLRTLAKQGKVFKVLMPSEYWIPVNDEPNFRKFQMIANGK